MASSPAYDRAFKVDMLLRSASSGCFYLLKKMARELDDGKGSTAETLREIKGSDGRGAFHLAAAHGRTDLCRYFVQDLNFSVDFRSEKGETPLYLSAMGGHLDTARYLISHGASFLASDIDGVTPLDCAAQHGKHEIVEFLLSLAVPVDLEIGGTGTALALAALRGQAETVEILLYHNANVNKAASSMFTPLKCAIYSGSLECTELLIEAGADLNMNCPLEMAAICCESLEVPNCLLKAGADPNVPNERGLLPIESAAMEGKSESMEMLFPLTSPVLEVKNWSVDGILQHVKSDAFKKLAGRAEPRSAQLRAEGNRFVKKNDYRAAVGIYSMAIQIDSKNASLFSNRSLCYDRLGVVHSALSDAQMAVSLRPKWTNANIFCSRV